MTISLNVYRLRELFTCSHSLENRCKQALLKVQGYEWLHSIFWAASFTDRSNTLYPGKPGRGGVFLYSKKEEWLQKI